MNRKHVPERDFASMDRALADVLQRLQERGTLSAEATAELSLAIERWKAGQDGVPTSEVLESLDAELSREIERLAAPATRFSRYRVQDEIGRGGMSVVYEVLDGDLCRVLAMKVATGGSAPSDGVGTGSRAGSRAGSRERMLRFLHEARVTGRLDHPGIVPVHDLGLDGNARLFFTMRKVEGRDLGEILRRMRAGEDGWTLPRALEVLVRVCDAVAYAHSKGVVHRDLKPSNVMTGSFGEVYVMDWGLAKVLGPPSREGSAAGPTPGAEGMRAEDPRPLLATLDGAVLGTPSYMAPEQARGDSDAIGPRADVYSIGAILYHLLTGVAPYCDRAESARSIWELLLDRPPTPIGVLAPQAPAELSAVCERAMARGSEERYPDAGALAADLRAWLDGRVVRAYETGFLAEMRKWTARNKLLAASLLLLLLSISAGALYSRQVEVRAKQDLRLTADTYTPSYLTAEAERLWPAQPGAVEELAGWLDVVEDLLSRSHLHRERADAARLPGAGFDLLERTRRERTVEELASLGDVEGEGMGGMRERLADAVRVREASSTGEAAVSAWQGAIASIADPARSPAHRGLVLRPQYGLLPIGLDPQSGLWEFAHLPSGEPPRRDPVSGKLELTEESCIVLVLLPGGPFHMGEQDDDRNAPNWVPQIAETRWGSPVHEIVLDPFFFSKYEMTQSQWRRATGSNPSYWGPGFEFHRAPEAPATTLLHPVEQISRVDCERVLPRLGLLLPTEAQWEYAARGGTTTVWWTGDERESLRGHVNLCDESRARAEDMAKQRGEAADWPGFDDGYPASSPVDRFESNPFGLHDTAGNVFEWCREAFGDYTSPTTPGDGERLGGDPKSGVLRGGSLEYGAALCRSAFRADQPPTSGTYHFGLRPSRAIER